MTTNITSLVQRLKVAAKNGCCHTLFPDDCLALVGGRWRRRISGLMNWRTMKFVNGWLTQSTNSTWLNWVKII